MFVEDGFLLRPDKSLQLRVYCNYDLRLGLEIQGHTAVSTYYIIVFSFTLYSLQEVVVLC